MKRTLRMLALLAAMLLLVAACATDTTGADEVVDEESPPSGSVEEESVPPEVSEPADTDTSGTDSIAALAADNPQLTQLTAALEAAGLTSVLEEAGPFTVFAPNDDAFAQLDQNDLTALLADPASLGDILQYHVVEGSVMSTDLEDGQTVTTLQGDDLTITIDGDTVMVNDATVVQADVQAGNGVIHVIDTVLMP